ncbi:uncharacterized protein LOC143301576 [Babylonia areolata]|uniref:uncharacterized protein LOC143301576 n=1 Tax=Babylonia areolata TaxID=304850 RepID=UPI003FD41677
MSQEPQHTASLLPDPHHPHHDPAAETPQSPPHPTPSTHFTGYRLSPTPLHTTPPPRPSLPLPPPHPPSTSDTDQHPTDLDSPLIPITSALSVLHSDSASESLASWGSTSRPPSPHPPPPPSLVPKLDMDMPTAAVSTKNHRSSPVATKAETDQFQIKNEFLDCLKQEHLGVPSPVKEGRQLRGLLMMSSSLKTASADDTASKTLLELAGQSVDTTTPEQTPFPAAASASHHALPHPSGLPGRGKKEEGEGEEPGMESTRPQKKVRHKKRVNGNKICLVCGDKALAHNFDVITCESCKAFFRRNALKRQNLQRCMFQNSCTIDKNTRRFCPSCRLNKCFDIGMKADLMLDEEERRLRREKKAQRSRHQAASSSTAPEDGGGVGGGGVGGEFLVESSSSAVPMDTTDAFFPHPTSTTTTTTTNNHHQHPGQSLPPSSSSSSSSSDLPQQASMSSLHHHPPPLPSFHTLRDTVGQSSSAVGQSSPYGGHSHSSSMGASPGTTTLSLPTSAENSPFSTFLTQLSTPSPTPFAAGMPAAQPHSVVQSQTAFAAGSVLHHGLSSGVVEFSSHKTHHHHHHHQPGSSEEEGVEKRQRQQEEESASPQCLDPVPSLMVENAPYPLPGPGARLFKHVPRDQLPSDPFMYWIVSPEERLQLANLTNAYQEVLLSLPERSLCRNTPLADSYLLHDFLNEIDDAMYKIVQFSKHISDFRQMRKEDQIAMLKSSAMHTFSIACCAAYVHERDCWLSLRGDLTSTHLRKLTNDDPFIQVGVEYCRSVKSLVKNDFTTYALIHCMILFDPRDAKIMDRQAINQTRDKYVIMLKHYLESQYSYLYADEYFVAIQERVREIIHLAKSGNAMFKRYTSAFQPLITEMLSSS